MGVNEYLLTAAALLPAVILGCYVFKKDRVEKEPVSLLILLFSLGILCCFPAAMAEEWLIELMGKIFSLADVHPKEGTQLLPSMFRVYNFVKYFIGVALVEEGCKLIALKAATRKNENFNCLFDGLIYAVFVSLGFAAFENVLYVLENGWINAFMRGVLSVPAHMFFAVLMGVYYSMEHITEKAAEIEKRLGEEGEICVNGPFNPKKYRYKKLLIPVAAHGLYDFCCTSDSGLAIAVFYGFVAFLYIYCFGKIKSFSEADGFSGSYAENMVRAKYKKCEEI